MSMYQSSVLWAVIVGVHLVLNAGGQSTNTTVPPPVVEIGGAEGNSTSQNTSVFPSYDIRDGEEADTSCRLAARDNELDNKIQQMADEDVKLINYEIRVGNWTPKYHLATEGWARVSNAHGQTLKSMEFTHGVMSFMTLTLGQQSLVADLVDIPPGCVQNLAEPTRNAMVLQLLLRDFGNESEVTISDPERICGEILTNENGVGIFRNR